MGSRARGAFDLLPVEVQCDLLREGWLQHSPQAQHPHPCLLWPVPPGSPSTAQSSIWYVLLAPSHQGPQRTPVLLQCRHSAWTAHLGKETPPVFLLGADWEEPSTGSTLVSPQGSTLGTDPGTGVGITAEHWWDRAACEMPAVFKPSTDCTPRLVLNLPSLAGIPAWAPSKLWEIRSVPLPTTAQEWWQGEVAGSRQVLCGAGGLCGGRWVLWGAGGFFGGQAGCLHSRGEGRAVCPRSRERLPCCLGHRAAAHLLPRGNSGCASHIVSQVRVRLLPPFLPWSVSDLRRRVTSQCKKMV